MNKIYSLFVIILILCFSSCNKTTLGDNYSLNYNIDLKNEYINIVGKTNDTQIVFMNENNYCLEYFKYVFVDNYLSKKYIYCFYNSIDDYRHSIKIHDDLFDGSYEIINEECLLIVSSFSNVDYIEYKILYERINNDTTNIIIE